MKFTFTLLLTLTSVFVFGQDAIKNADKYYKELEFDKAIALYEQIAEADPSEQEIAIKIADSYFLKGDYASARLWFMRGYRQNSDYLPEIYFLRMMVAIKVTGDQEFANQLLAEYYKEDSDRSTQLRKQQKALDGLQTANKEFVVWPLDINSEAADFAPMYYKGDLIFASSRTEEKNNKKIYAWNKQPYLDFYKAEEVERTHRIQKVSPFEQGKGFEFHEASICFTPDYKTVYFARNYTHKNSLKVNKEGISNMQILKASMDGEKIIDPVPLSFNHPDYSCGHPSLSADGKYLYFSSNMPGGYGQSDIYRAEIYADGTTGPAVNMGETINTAGREMFPFIRGQQLFFSSDGHFGYGGLDIFESMIGADSQHTIPLNLGKPVNSKHDDFSLIMAPEENAGYFASNRPQDAGDDDLYYFKELAPDPLHWLSGKIKNLHTTRRIGHIAVKAYDDKGELFQEITTGAHGGYELQLEANKTYTIEFSGEDFVTETLELSAKRTKPFTYSFRNVFLVSRESIIDREKDFEKIRINPIEFQSNGASLGPEGYHELDKVIYALNMFPEMKIKIESHTDCRGGERSNLELSNARAKVCYDYLLSKGITPDRVTSIKGYGESRPLNHCKDGITCSEEELAPNRRSEFIIEMP